ncbi:MAG: efflux RND transporter periplasmic adaptor subunit [Bacteroidales bacterium]|nr:efflux RND transporter periplasmic adaptor subunit [Bacteroidales bacterium]
MKKQFLFIFSAALITLVITSCKEKQEVQAPPLEIGIVKVLQQDVPIYKDFVGQMYGLKDIPIRARVEGFLDNIYFNEGTRVEKGQLLYAIDPQPFLADVAAQESKLAEAKIILVNAENELARYKPLAEINAVSKSDLDAAQSTRDAAESSVEAAKANLRLSEINLGYTKVYSPIQGVIGKTEAREGEFVGKSPNPVILNTVSRIDTMRVQFFLTEAEYLILIKEVLERDRSQVKTRVRDQYNLELLLSDGSKYPLKGRTDFINRNIDPTTGSMLVEAHFPNTDGILRPGLYAKVRARMEVLEGALLVPQRCVIELQGQYSVFVVDENNTVQSRQVAIGERIGDLWLVTEGLNPGEGIVIDGLQKVGTGMKVNPALVEFESQTNLQ